ncbi:hypothetical protein DPMN_179836 [Dreissena polymorpha]|uniref:Ribosomal protein n=1 Tax=Dreissena polymorpha TaxID=45954 RepID=A0A9D4EHV2_DREPO|nr:hypothetical protein DPMN_179836 [Dreissena polymorpha]
MALLAGLKTVISSLARGPQCQLKKSLTVLSSVRSSLLLTNHRQQKDVTEISLLQPQGLSLTPLQGILLQQCRTYKPRDKLKLRCAGCYFERRQGRLYVECSIKPRHKQMQLVTGLGFYRDEYSKGRWREAVYWNYHKHDEYYRSGDNQWSKYRWLGDRIGKDL